jgi:hypothetical protein
MDQVQEGLVVISIYLFFLSAVCIPILVVWFTHQINKRINRIDYLLILMEEAEKYHENTIDTTEGS